MTFYTKTSGFAADAAVPLANDMAPVPRAFKFRSRTRANCLTTSNLYIGKLCVYGSFSGIDTVW